MDSYGQLQPSLFKDILIYCSVTFKATFNVTFKAIFNAIFKAIFNVTF